MANVKMLLLRLISFFLYYLLVLATSAKSAAHSKNDGKDQLDRKEVLRMARHYREEAYTRKLDNLQYQSQMKTSMSFYEKAIDMLSASDNEDSDDDKSLLSATMYEFSELLFDANLPGALTPLLAAAHFGYTDAVHRLATIYATGVYTGIYPMDGGRSLMLEYMAALAGSPEGNMAMGYRYAYGIGITASCESALKHYEYVANIVAADLQRDIFYKYVERSTIPEIENGRRSGRKDIDAEVIDYYTYLANEKDVSASSALGLVYMCGSRYIKQDLVKSIKNYQIASDAGNVAASGSLCYILAQSYYANVLRDDIAWTGKEDGIQLNKNENVLDKILKLCKLSHNAGDALGILGMGYLHYKGVGTPIDHAKAMEYFKKASNKHQDAAFYMGEILMGEGQADARIDKDKLVPIDIPLAIMNYATSSQRGNVLALHRLSHMTASGVGISRSCQSALNGFKNVAERGVWMHQVNDAYKFYEQGNLHAALSIFAKYAAMGVESSQFNAAHILSMISCPVATNLTMYDYPQAVSLVARDSNFMHKVDEGSMIVFPSSNELNVSTARHVHVPQSSNISNNIHSNLECEVRALALYGLSAGQGDAEAYIRIGDFYYYGRAGSNVNKLDAASYYQLAADLRHTQAVFNLGIMYEIGDGVPQDFHLAKRYFDQAAEYDLDAKVPCMIALFVLSNHKLLQEYIGTRITIEVVLLCINEHIYRYLPQSTVEFITSHTNSFINSRIAGSSVSSIFNEQTSPHRFAKVIVTVDRMYHMLLSAWSTFKGGIIAGVFSAFYIDYQEQITYIYVRYLGLPNMLVDDDTIDTYILILSVSAVIYFWKLIGNRRVR